MVSSKLVHMSVNNLSMHWMWGKVAEDLPISSACSLIASKIMVLCCTSFSLFVFHCNRNNNNKLTTTTTTTTEIWYYHILIMQTVCSYHQSHWIKPEMYRRSHLKTTIPIPLAVIVSQSHAAAKSKTFWWARLPSLIVTDISPTLNQHFPDSQVTVRWHTL